MEGFILPPNLIETSSSAQRQKVTLKIGLCQETTLMKLKLEMNTYLRAKCAIAKSGHRPRATTLESRLSGRGNVPE